MQRNKDISMILQLHFSKMKSFSALFVCKLVNIPAASKNSKFTRNFRLQSK